MAKIDSSTTADDIIVKYKSVDLSSDEQIKTSENNSVSETVTDQPAGKRIFKIIVIGDSNVGKTCLTFRFCSGKFPEKTEATIGVDFREKWVDVGDEKVKLQIWDTAGQERFRRSMVQHYYRNVHAVIYVYDVTRVSSFENLPSWIAECDAHGLGISVPRILVGNKCDVREDSIETPCVSTSLAQRFADSYGMPLFETSAKDNSQCDHVESIFLTLALKLRSAKPLLMQTATIKPTHVTLVRTEQSSSVTGGYCLC